MAEMDSLALWLFLSLGFNPPFAVDEIDGFVRDGMLVNLVVVKTVISRSKKADDLI